MEDDNIFYETKEDLFVELKDEDFESEQLYIREKQINSIYQDVLHISSMMTDLNTLVLDQGENIKLIEESTQHAKTESEKAHHELVKADELQSSYYKKIYYLPVIFGTIVVGFFGLFRKN